MKKKKQSVKLEDEKQENLEWLEREINEVKKVCLMLQKHLKTNNQ